jgi:choline dehydrogenase-like flavoprotein
MTMVWWHVGSGAGGGTLGNELAQKGVKVVI